VTDSIEPLDSKDSGSPGLVLCDFVKIFNPMDMIENDHAFLK